jgi:hypothetical protein
VSPTSLEIGPDPGLRTFLLSEQLLPFLLKFESGTS